MVQEPQRHHRIICLRLHYVLHYISREVRRIYLLIKFYLSSKENIIQMYLIKSFCQQVALRYKRPESSQKLARYAPFLQQPMHKPLMINGPQWLGWGLLPLGINGSQRLGWEEFEDTKGIVRIRIPKKNRQHNGQKKKEKQQSTKLTHKTKDRISWITRTSRRTGG